MRIAFQEKIGSQCAHGLNRNEKWAQQCSKLLLINFTRLRYSFLLKFDDLFSGFVYCAISLSRTGFFNNDIFDACNKTDANDKLNVYVTLYTFISFS